MPQQLGLSSSSATMSTRPTPSGRKRVPRACKLVWRLHVSLNLSHPSRPPKEQLLAIVMEVLWIRHFRCLPDDNTVACVTSNGMIRQEGMSGSESLWNAIEFLQHAFQDQPDLFGSRSMESLFGTGTALHYAAKRLVPDPDNAVAATERGLEYSPLIASALVECVFFDAGAPGPLRKAHEPWAAARVGVCKNHAAWRQFEAQRSANGTGPAASNAEPDDGPVCARGDDGDGHIVTRRATVNDGEPGGSSDAAGDSGGGGGGGATTAALHAALTVAHGGGWTTNLPRLVVQRHPLLERLKCPRLAL